MLKILLPIAALLVLSSDPLRADEAVELYGPARQEVLQTPNLRVDTKEPANFLVHVLPWQESANKTLDEQLARILDNPPPGEEFAPTNPPKLIQIANDFSISMPVMLKSDPANSRAALLFACDYKDKNEHYREIMVVGDMIALLSVGKKPIMDHIFARGKKICKESPTKAKRAALRRLVTTEPGKGDGVDRLAHMVFALKQGLNGYGTFQVTYSTYALFDDGLAIRGTGAALPDFDVEASRRLEPKRWAKWRETDSGRFELSWPRDDGEEKWSKIQGSYRTVKPTAEAVRLDGRYSYTASYGPLFDGGTTVNKSYTFREDGTYSTTSSSLSSSADIMGSTVNRVSTAGPDGCATATSISGGIVGGTSKTDPSCGDGKAGTYEIGPWVLTLHANNGKIRRFPFFMTGEDSFYLNGQDWGKN